MHIEISVLNNYYSGQRTGPIFFKHLQCDSSETSLDQCVNTSQQIIHPYFYHYHYVVGVRCEHITQIGNSNTVLIFNILESAMNIIFLTDCVEGSIHLAGGNNNTEGRIEICHNRIWGSICDHGWDTIDVEVLCYQLGFYPYG